MSTLETGQAGERAAARYYQRHGFRILARNYRAGRHEIDLIAEEKATGRICFVEVKTRSVGGLGRPMEAVNAAKQRFLYLAAMQWLSEHDAQERAAQFDVAEVLLPQMTVNRVENAFSLAPH